jgi:hypothetical protein
MWCVVVVLAAAVSGGMSVRRRHLLRAIDYGYVKNTNINLFRNGNGNITFLVSMLGLEYDYLLAYQ